MTEERRPEFEVRQATVADAAVIAHHRASMFRDMGRMPPSQYQLLVDMTVEYLRLAMSREEYFGWLAAPKDSPTQIVSGAGVQRRRTLPHPGWDGTGSLVRGFQGIVLNVYTEREWRRRGLADLVMKEVLTWARTSGLETLVLHASTEGRPLYERLGFVQTNEMRFNGRLA